MSDGALFEAKLYAYRKDAKGLIVSFVVQPNDVPNELALADIGQRFGIVIAQLGEGKEIAPTASPVVADQGRCCEASESRSEEGRARYALSQEPERAVTRAAILCSEPQFQEWIFRKNVCLPIPTTIRTESDKAAFRLRRHLGIDSRSRIASEQAAYAAFTKLETQYKLDTNQMAEPR